jgi:hypothetical protein
MAPVATPVSVINCLKKNMASAKSCQYFGFQERLLKVDNPLNIKDASKRALQL